MKELERINTCIEGIPFITRFKTSVALSKAANDSLSIEGIPFITRFKTISFSTIQKLKL